MSDCLPQEVLIEIFTRLPVKTLLQLRSLCKRWHSLISDPVFITAHINRANPTQKLILRHFSQKGFSGKEKYMLLNDDQTVGDHDVKLQFPFKTRSKSYFKIVGSCNGLLCLSDDLGDHAYGIILWNPSIRKFFTLPRPCVTQRTHGSSTLVLGFGFDANSNDYKVVRIGYMKNRNGRELIPPEVEVFKLSSGSWRSFNAGAPPYGMYGYTGSNAFVNGAVHWIGYDPCKRDKNCLIVSFDMCDEVFREVMLPDDLIGCGWDLTVSRYNDSLLVLHYEKHGKELFCSMWVMKEYGMVSSWVKLFNIDLWGGLHKILGFRQNGEVLVDTKRGKLVSYDLSTGQMRGFGLRGALDSFYVDTYVESLVLVEAESVVPGADAITCDGEEDDGDVLQWTGHGLENVEENKGFSFGGSSERRFRSESCVDNIEWGNIKQ